MGKGKLSPTFPENFLIFFHLHSLGEGVDTWVLSCKANKTKHLPPPPCICLLVSNSPLAASPGSSNQAGLTRQRAGLPARVWDGSADFCSFGNGCQISPGADVDLPEAPISDHSISWIAPAGERASLPCPVPPTEPPVRGRFHIAAPRRIPNNPDIWEGKCVASWGRGGIIQTRWVSTPFPCPSSCQCRPLLESQKARDPGWRNRLPWSSFGIGVGNCLPVVGDIFADTVALEFCSWVGGIKLCPGVGSEGVPIAVPSSCTQEEGG